MAWYKPAWQRSGHINLVGNGPSSLMTDSGTHNHAGQAILCVVSTTGFGPGQPVTISDDLNSETGTIVTVDSPTEVTVAINLANDYHAANNGVVKIGPIPNYSMMLDAFFNCCPIEADSCTQFHYRPAVRYVGAHDRTYIAGANALGTLSIRQWDEDDLLLSVPVPLFDFTGTAQEDHKGACTIVLQHQTGANAVANGTILVLASAAEGDGIYSKRSTNAEDITLANWGAQITHCSGAYAGYSIVFETTDGVVFALTMRDSADPARTLDTYLSVLKVGLNGAANEPDNDKWSAGLRLIDVGEAANYWTYSKGWIHGDDIHIASHGHVAGVGYHDIWYSKITHITVGTATTNTANKLQDNGADFTTIGQGVSAEWYACNLNPDAGATPTMTKVTARDSATVLDFGAGDPFPDGDEPYVLFCVEIADGTEKHIPLDKSNADHTPDKVHASNASTSACVYDVKSDGGGNPYILWYHYEGVSVVGTSVALYRAVYVDGAWVSTDTGISLYHFPTGIALASGAELDEGYPDTIFAAVPDGASKCQIQKWAYTDSAAVDRETFEWGANTDHLHSGGFVPWDALSNDQATISTDQAYTGTRGGKFAGHATPGMGYFALPVGNDYTLHIKVYKETLQQYCIPIRHGNGVSTIQIAIDSAENLLYCASAGDDPADPSTWTDTTKNITADAWNLIEIRNINWAAKTYDIYLNSLLAKSGATMYDAATYANVWLIQSTDINAGQDFYVDNIVVAGKWAKTEDITESAPGHNFRPIHVLNGGGHFELLWFYTERYANTVGWDSMRLASPGFNNQHFIGLGKNCQDDFEDLLFALSTDADDTSSLGYFEAAATGSHGQPWFQERTNRWRATLWIGKFICPVKDGTIEIFYYHDHSIGNRVNDNDQVVMDAQFLACDDFLEAVGDAVFNAKWDLVSTVEIDGASSLKLTSTSVVGDRGDIRQDALIPTFLYAECRSKSKGSDTTPGDYNAIHGMRQIADIQNHSNVINYSNSINQVLLWTADHIGAPIYTLTTVNFQDVANWHIHRIAWQPGSTKFYNDWGRTTDRRAAALLATHTTHVDTEPEGLTAGEGTTAGAGYVLIDWMFARPLTTEPTITVAAGEYYPVKAKVGGSNVGKLVAVGIL
jgi:hypothetical protein